MVRETRHLWIGNLPVNVREEQIRDLFQRHGRVQSVKFLPDDGISAVPGIAGSSAGRTGKSATVAFIDIRSAAKALRAVHSMAGQPLQITYHEPGSVPSRNLHVSEHSSPGDAIPSTPTNECGTNCVPAIPPGNSVPSVAVSGVTNGPAASATGSGLYRQRFPLQHGQSEDSSSHFYEQPKSFSRGRGDGHGFHGGRGRREHRHLYHSNRLTFPTDRNYRVPWGYPNEARYAPSAHSEVDERTTGPPSSSHPQQNEASSKATRRPDSPASSVSSRHLHSKRHKSRSVSESGSSDRGSSGGSRSRSGSRSSVSTSVSSARSRSPPHHNSSGHYSSSRGGSPGSRFHQNSYNSRRRCSRSRLVSSRLNDSTRVRHSSRSPHLPASPTSSESSSPSPHRKIIATPHSPSHSPSSAKSYSPSRSINQSGHHHHHHHHHHQRRQLNSSELQSAIRIRNLPTRSTDTSLKDGLYHEYKKHGKVSWVRVIGTGSERYAIVCFKSAEHANRAVESSQDKQFFGCKIQVSRFYNGRGDETIGLNDEDSRGLSEDEFSPVSNTTRTVLITGLDTNIDYKELKTELGQCGDIVTLDIRTQGASTVAVCEFVDIASAIRAQWVRHVCKSREAITRINFVRTSPSASILLDGTEGFNEKLITARCSQYGAITRVTTDVERNLTLVQFEEISCAQTAVREIRSWSVKGKHIHVDFTSPDCIRLFLERIAANNRGVMPDSLPNSHRTLPASCYTDAAIGKDPNRRRRNINDVEFEPSKPMTHLRLLDESGSPESASSCHLRDGKNNSGMLSGDDENNGRIYRRPDVYSSSLSPDTDRVGMADDASVDTRGGKSEPCKIDLNCHENDSAVVTSSSDVINGDADAHENYDRALVNGNGKHSKFEFSRVNSTASKSTIVAVAVDGVSSTSPEPKVEAVRTASPDPGVGLPMLEAGGKITDSHIITTGLADPRKKPNESKIRRSSADSGSNTTSSTLYTNGSEGGEESDDRPGTPLCDENPENFFANENNNVSVKVPLPHMSNLTKPDQPLSLPLPGFAHRYPHYTTGNQNSRHNNVDAVSSKETKVSLRRSSETIVNKSPIKSPQYEGTGSVMNSSASDCETISPIPYSESKLCASDRLNDVFSLPSSKSTNTNSWHESNVAELNSSSVPLEGFDQPVTNYLNARSTSVDSVDEICSPGTGIVENSCDKEFDAADSNPGVEKNIGAASSSDSESGSSPSISPTEKSLDERLSLFYDQYNQWEGNRSSARAVPLHRSNVPSGESASRSVAPKIVPSTPVGGDCPEPSPLTRFPRTKHKVLDLDEMRHQPSDIVKSLLAKKSVFDEDTKRLENFGEKYEAKGTPIAANWRSLAKPPNSPVPTTYSSTNSVASPTRKPPSPPTQHVSVFQSPTTTATQTSANRAIHHNSNSQISATKAHQQQPASGVTKPTVKDLNYNNSCSGIWQSLNNKPFEKPLLSAAPSKISVSGSLGQQKASIELAMKTMPIIPTSPVPSSTYGKSLQEIHPPGSTIVLSRSNASSKNTSMLSANLSPGGSENAISQSVLYPNIPRTVERSMSLDSKRISANASQVSSSAGCSPTSMSNSSPVSTTPVAANLLSHRRISADSHGLAPVMKDTLTVKKSEPLFTEGSKKCVKETPTALTKDHLAKVVQAKDDLSSKGVGLIKTEPSVVQHPNHPPETTVAVVASLQSPVVLSKDSKRDSRDKKRRNSGSSTPTMSNPPASMTSSSSRSEIPSIGTPKPCTSSSRERKEKEKEKDIKRVTNEETVSGPNCNTGHHTNISNHHHSKSKSKDKIKEEKEHHNTESASSITTSSNKDAHSHRKEKDKDKEFNKLKRRLSSQESEQATDSKKSKLEKKEVTESSKESNSESHSNHNSGKSKYSSTTSIERRESRDSSSSTKEKPKENREKSERDGGKFAEAGGSSSKDHHHKAKLSSSSSSSSSTSKHHHANEKKTSNENHTSSTHTHKSSSDSFKKKEKSSSKESSKSKHSSGSSHSHSHHGSVSSTGIKKEASSKARSSSWKDKESKSKDKTFDSDDEHESVLATPTSVEKDKAREKSKDRSEKHEKREESVKRDRHKSGDSSSAPNSADTKRMRSKQEKKKRRNRIIVDETESSDSGKSGDEDDDDKQKHHSIFEVVIDEYPSMYDKVKARSNRACKNATAQQQKEEQRKQEKLKEQFQQLKQSRAKREEKKRSTSIEERKSYVNSSSDESDVGQHIDSDNGSGNFVKLERERERHHSRVQETGDEPTSDEEEARNHKGGIPPKLSEKVRSKSKSRSLKTNQSTKHRGKKSMKSSPPCTSSFASTSSIFYSHSDEDSRNSSPPAIKKRKVKHQTVGMNAGSIMSHQSMDTKSSDDSASDFDDSNVIMSNVTLPSLPPKKYSSSSSSSKLKKLRMAEIYTDSDSSIRSSRGVRNSTTPSKSKPSREKISTKQKSVDLKKLFDDTSETSGDEESNSHAVARREKESKDKDETSKRSKDKEREPKDSVSGRKKSLSSSGTSIRSYSKGQRRRLSSEETGQNDIHHSVTKSDHSATMKDILFGSTSGSDAEEKPIADERPKTPTPMIMPVVHSKPVYDETPLSSKSKSKTSRKQRSLLHLQTIASSHENSGSYEDDSMDAGTPITPVTSSSSGKPEKKKRRHHKDKKSRRTESQETVVTSSVHSTSVSVSEPIKIKTEAVDVDSLFNSPQSSPRDTRPSQGLLSLGKPPDTCRLAVDVTSSIFGTAASQRSPILDVMKPKPVVKDFDDSGSKSMFSFSTDEDEDELKIDISAVIKASDEQPDESEIDAEKDVDSEQTLMAEEEEKKMHCLFEQDKAIESIVLLDRRTPPPVVNEEDVNPKDEIPKDEVAISQEETEDAVADLLETLGGDDPKSEDEEQSLVDKSLPPTIRILAELPPPTDDMEITREPPIPDYTKPEGWYDTKSPKDLLIDEGVIARESEMETPINGSRLLPVKLPCDISVPPVHLHTKPKTPEIISEQAKPFTSPERPVDAMNEGKITKDIRAEAKETSVEGGAPSTASTDVYEFTDSDDEKSEETHPLAHCKSTITVPPVKSPTVTACILEPADTSHKPQGSETPGFLVKSDPPVLPVVPSVTTATVGTSPKLGGPSSAPSAEDTRTANQPITPVISISSASNGSVVKSTPVIAPVRTTVDDTIDEVIRMAQNDTLLDTIITPRTTQTSRSRSRSHSKDTVEDVPGSHASMLNTPLGNMNKVGSCLTIEPTPRRSDPSLLVQSAGIPPATASTGEYQTAPRRETEKDPDAVQENLVDPQTGILTPMLRHSGEYVPVLHSGAEGPPPNMLTHHLQIPLRTTEIINKAMEQRQSVLEHMPQPHQQQVTQSKVEGLPAILAQQQQHGGSQKTPVIQQQQSPQMQHNRSPGLTTQPIGQYQKGVISHGAIPKAAIIYTSPGAFPSSKAGFNPNVPVSSMPQSSSPISSLGMYTGKTTISQSSVPLPKPNFGTQTQPNSTSPTASYVTLVRPVEHMSPSIQQRPIQSSNQRGNQNFQTQLVRIPEVPSTTQVTITKVNTTEEQQRKSAIVQHGNVIVTSTTVTSPPSSGPTNQMARIVPSVHSMQHHPQQIPSQAELLRIGCIVNKEDPRQPNFRTNDMYASAQPPRVEVSASVVMAASHSPKGIRNPQQLEPSQPQLPQRNFPSHHTITFDSPMAEVLSYTRQAGDASHYMTNQANHPQPVYQGHFTPVSMAGSAPGNIVQVQQGMYGVRKGVNENIVQQQQKRGTPELHKGGATLTLITPDRSIPQPLHVPPHLTSPHPSEQRSSESPMIATVYNQRMYGPPVPAHHQPPRPTFPNPYAELEERPYAGSPSYHPYEQRVLERDREIQRDSSPYPNVVGRRVVSPPPAHIRYSLHPSMSGEAASPTGRPRPQISADSHGDQAPSQGDSPLLMLLQRYPIMWQGLLALKNDSAACQMHFVSGNLNVARDSLPSPPDGTIPPLRISQRMRLEQTQLEGVARKMQMEPEYCMLLALPCGRDEIDVLQQSNNLRTGFITYLQLKQAAGIVNICHPVNQQPAYVIHIFPSCDFANEKLANIAPDLLNGVADIAHLLIIIATV